MIFLIEYEKIRGRLVNIFRYEQYERSWAEKARLQKELDLNRDGLKHEVVLLEAESAEALHKTHKRYFSSVEEMTGSEGALCLAIKPQ
jgi:hypothetical protein